MSIELKTAQCTQTDSKHRHDDVVDNALIMPELGLNDAIFPNYSLSCDETINRVRITMQRRGVGWRRDVEGLIYMQTETAQTRLQECTISSESLLFGDAI